MTEQEMLDKIKKLEEERKKLEENIRNQNSYITKLEGKTKEVSTSTETPDFVKTFVQKTVKRETINEAMEEISKSVDQNVIDILKPELNKFLEDTMTGANTTNVQYVIDAFSLIWGRALRKKDHPIHSIGKAEEPKQEQKPNVPLSEINKIIKSTPQGMSNADSSAGKILPNESSRIKNTRDAFSSFKSRLGSIGSNKFN